MEEFTSARGRGCFPKCWRVNGRLRLESHLVSVVRHKVLVAVESGQFCSRVSFPLTRLGGSHYPWRERRTRSSDDPQLSKDARTHVHCFCLWLYTVIVRRVSRWRRNGTMDDNWQPPVEILLHPSLSPPTARPSRGRAAWKTALEGFKLLCIPDQSSRPKTLPF